MGFQISPGVNVTEIDLTNIVPAVSTTDGALAGAFQWGPVEEIKLVANEDILVERFGRPDDNTYIDFFTAANFLAYGNKLRLVRVIDSATAVNSSVSGDSDVLIKNEDDYDANWSAGPGSAPADADEFAGKYPGTRVEGVELSVCGSAQAFEQARTLSSTGTALHESTTLVPGDDLEDVVEVGTIVSDTVSGEERSVASITAGTSEALTTTGTDIDGTATAFLTTLSVGMMLESGGERRVVVAIADDTNATLDAAFTVDVSPAAALPTLVVVLASAFTVDLASSATLLQWKHKSLFGIAPGTSDYVAARGGSNDEMHIVLIDAAGNVTGRDGEVLELFSFISAASDAKSEDGSSLYYVDVLNRQSEIVWWTDHPAAGVNWGSVASGTAFTEPTTTITLTLTGGVDGNSISDADKINGYDLFKNTEEVDVSLVLGSDASPAVAIHLINNICEFRLDCIALLSPEFADVVNNAGDEVDDIITYRSALPSSSFGVLDSGWKFQFDKYNDTMRWVPLNGDIGGLIVRTDITRDPWWSPAGLNRGQIKNSIKLAFNPNKAERDDLYARSVNSVVTFPGEGTVLFGDKTLLSKPSAFDRINVRRLFIVLEKAIATAAKFLLFEFNDEFTRQSFRNLVEPFLRDVQGRRGIFDFRVIADETNNTPEVIDRNEFVGDIYIKPARSINFIQLNFIAVRTGVEFSEIVGQF